jgi:hypothetical protein
MRKLSGSPGCAFRGMLESQIPTCVTSETERGEHRLRKDFEDTAPTAVRSSYAWQLQEPGSDAPLPALTGRYPASFEENRSCGLEICQCGFYVIHIPPERQGPR